ncbi:MAG: hypothetical protein QNJ38_16485 [Prochloraceae cyanobacterium]|nr:hypothetical protein [Prochloraceae cyanobacterium]
MFKIGGLVEELKGWFSTEQAKIKARAADLEAKLTKQDLNPLPKETKTCLSDKISDLIPHSVHIAAVKSQLEEAIERWQSDSTAANSLVILVSPVEPVEAIFKEVLAEKDPTKLAIESLPHALRSPDGSQTKERILEKLDLSQDRKSTLTAIPDLSWCFLRCAEGLEAIEHLQEMILGDRERFWLIGCNNWTWQYLDCVCNLSSYLEQTFCLPTLKGIELKDWLKPVSETIDFEFAYDLGERDRKSIDKDKSELNPDGEENWTSESEKRYYEHLAYISLGLSRVAAKLWLESLYAFNSEEEDEDDDKDESKGDRKPFIFQRATLPELPSLTKEDRYLLHSLNLHGDMTLSELALSLGDQERKIQRQVRSLQRSGIIEAKSAAISLNPRYYPKVRTNLDNNRFLVGGL